MSNLTIEMPDRSLEGIAAAQRKTVDQLARNRAAQVPRMSTNSMPSYWLAGCLSGRVTVFHRPIVIYLLDTNAIRAVMRADVRTAAWLLSIGLGDRVAVRIITRGEILFGLERLVLGRRRTELEA